MKHLLAVVFSLIFTLSAHANPLTGNLSVTGGYVASNSAVSGEIDVAANTLSLAPSRIFGQPAVFVVSELLSAGTYTRTYTTASGTTLTRTETIPAGMVGGYFVIETYGIWYQVFNVWSVSAGGTVYTTVDFPGNVLKGGALNGRRAVVNFTILPPPDPVMSLSIDASGGTVHECTSPDGATVAFTSHVTIEGNATLDSVSWYIDGVFAGSGDAFDLTVPLGTHVIHADAVATNGTTSASAEISVDVRDTTAPLLEIQFLNSQGQPVTSASLGGYSVHFVTQDACDPAPVVTAAAKPVMNVSEGDTITINSISDVQLPTTAVEVTATARDVNGQTSFANATLAIH